MISNKEINLEKKFCEDLRRNFKNKARGYPQGSICFRYEHGKHRPYWNLDNRMIYLKKEQRRLVSRLLEKKINEKKLKYIEKNIGILERMDRHYKGIEYILGEGIIRELEEKIGRGFKASDYLMEDKNSNKPAEFRTKNKIHKTPAGIIVRSKAELVIGTFLEMKGIQYIYEQPLKLYLRTVAPDFTIKRASDGKTIIWEHFGRMDDAGYYSDTMDKLYDYHSVGWLPYDNFIATFGEKDTPMDMTVLETICETMLR